MTKSIWIVASMARVADGVPLSRTRLDLVIGLQRMCIFIGDDVIVETKANMIKSVNCDGRLYRANQPKYLSSFLTPEKNCELPDDFALEDLERIVDQVCFGMATENHIEAFLDKLVSQEYPASLGTNLMTTIPFALAFFRSERGQVEIIRSGDRSNRVIFSHANFNAEIVVDRQLLRSLNCSQNKVNVQNKRIHIIRMPETYGVFDSLCNVFFDKVAIYTTVVSSEGTITTFWNFADSVLTVRDRILAELVCNEGEGSAVLEPHDTLILASPESISFSRLCTGQP